MGFRHYTRPDLEECFILVHHERAQHAGKCILYPGHQSSRQSLRTGTICSLRDSRDYQNIRPVLETRSER